MKFCLFATNLFLFWTAFARADSFEVETSYYNGLGTKMRQEKAIRIDGTGNRQPIQTRIYVDATNQLREASFLQKDGTWKLYGDTNLPAELKTQIELVNKKAATPSRDSKLVCEMISTDFVSCNGVIYKREQGGKIIQGILGRLKSTPAVLNTVEDEDKSSGTGSAISAD